MCGVQIHQEIYKGERRALTVNWYKSSKGGWANGRNDRDGSTSEGKVGRRVTETKTFGRLVERQDKSLRAEGGLNTPKKTAECKLEEPEPPNATSNTAERDRG